MKRSKLLFIVLNLAVLTSLATAQTIGIGTSAPDTNTVLDISSSKKGILLPRISDTTVVVNPSAGLLIYNQNQKSPYFHDGTMWRNLATPLASNTGNPMNPLDSLTYTITNSAGIVVNGTFKVLRFSHGGTNSGSVPDMNVLTFSKSFDANSIPFKRILASSSTNQLIEFKIFAEGTTSPYLSIKLTNWKISEENFNTGPGLQIVENYTFTAAIIGFKDWINNNSFSWNAATGQLGSY